MSSHYDRRSIDKENSYDHSYYPSNTPKQTSISNDQLRRKLDHNLALMEKNPSNTNEDEHENYKPNSDYSNIKRDNARRRGFDLKVSNIDSINDKITGLLSMVRKDKQRQIMETQPRQRPEACKTPNPGLLDRVKRTNANNGERYTPTLDKNVSSFVDVSARDRKRGIYNFEDSVELKRNDLDHFERKMKLRSKIQEQDNSINPISFDRSGKQRESSWLNVQHKEQSPLREIKNYAYKEDNTARKQLADQKKHFDTMLEQRRKQRMMNRQYDRQKSENRLTNKSAIKHKYSYSQLEESINVNKRDSPIIKVCEQNFRYKQDRDEPFVRIKTPSPKKQSPRARDKDRFPQIAYLEEGGQKREKINTAARLIDQQLLRIKSKITESETNQKRLQNSYKPRANAEPSRTKEHIIRIAESISAQVKFDTNLKPAREAFDAIEGQQKWHELEQKLSVKGLRLSKNFIKQIMKIGPDEHNPFGGAKKSFDIQELVELIVAAEKNWEDNTLKCASARSLKSENFEVSDLDLHNKGYLGLEDLVCFVNLYSNTFYRNRDMVLIMRRLQLFEGSQGVSGIGHATFLNAFSA